MFRTSVTYDRKQSTLTNLQPGLLVGGRGQASGVAPDGAVYVPWEREKLIVSATTSEDLACKDL